MENVKITKIYGAKCTKLSNMLFILTRSRCQLDSQVAVDLGEPKQKVELSIKNSCSKSIEIEVVVTTSDGRIISIGKLSPKNTSINFDTSSFGTECLITGLKFDIKNSGMHQRQIVLEGSTT